MLKKHIITIHLVLLCLGSIGQTQKLDSLLIEEAKFNKSDSVHADLFSEIAVSYYRVDLEKMKAYSDSARLLSEEIGYSKGVIDANQKIALYYRLNGNLDTSIYLNNLALQTSHKINYKYGIAKCNMTLANIYKQSNDLDKAIEYYENSLVCFRELNHKGGEAAVTCNLGVIHRKRSQYSEALKGYQNALNLYKEIDDIANQSMVYRSIAIMYRILGDIPKAVNNFLQALELQQITGDKRTEARTLNSLGLIHLDQKEFNKALEFFKKSLDVAIQSNNRTSIAIAYSNIGMVELKKDNLLSAIENFNIANQIATELDHTLFLSSANNGLAEVYDRMGKDSLALEFYLSALELRKIISEKTHIAQSYINLGKFYNSRGNFKNSKLYFEKGLEIAKQDQNIANIRDAAQGLSEINEKMKNYNAALSYYKLYEQMADSIINESKAKKITRQLLNFDHENELAKIANEQKEKDRIQELQNARIQSARNYFIIAFVFSILLVVVIFMALRRKRIANVSLMLKNKEIEEKTNELIKLDNFKESMTSMLVHDLKNPLNNILNFPKSDYLQYTDVVNVSGLVMLNLVENILDVQKFEESGIEPDCKNFNLKSLINKTSNEVDFLIQEKTITFHNNIDHSVCCFADIDLIHRVFINLLSNAIKFSSLNSNISIDCEEIPESNQVKIIVSDEGEGIPENMRSKIFDKFTQSEVRNSGSIRSTGLGLAYCKLAIEAHKGKIGVESNIESGAAFWFTLLKGESNHEIHSADNMIKSVIDYHNLTVKEKEIVKTNIEQLRKLAIYKSSAIREIISQIPEQTEGIVNWKSSLTEAVYSGNEHVYRRIIEMGN